MSFTLIAYSETEYKESKLDNIEDSFPYLDSGDGNITWLEIDSMQEEAVKKKLIEHLGISPLIQKYLDSSEQRSKVQKLDKFIFITLKNYNLEDKDARLRPEQIKILLGKNFVISYCENKSAILDKIRVQIKSGFGHTRSMGADYLAYKILDSVIDNYHTIYDTIEAVTDEIGKDLLDPAQRYITQKIANSVQSVVIVRRSIIPLEDLTNKMSKMKSELLDDSFSIYLEDAHDHTVEIKELLDSNYEILSRMIDIYNTILSNRANKVIQTLTIIATIFIPLTFIVGIYGMNFQIIPELNWSYGYYAIMIFMLLVALSLLYYFRKKRWL